MEAELYKQNPWWEEEFVEKSICREIYLDKLLSNLDNKEIIFLTGLRRVGKTTVLKQMISDLLKKGISKSDILFLNLDSYNFTDYSIHDLVEKYREIHKKGAKDFFYLFLDEVAEKENFDHELKSLYDNDNVKIFCSSSKATLMSDRRAFLTGRTKTIEMLPLTFKEFLKFKEVEIKKSDKAKLEAYFKEYLRVGGVPYYVLTEDNAYLNELIKSIIYKDVIAQYHLSNEKLVNELFLLLCERVGKVISFNKLAKMLSVTTDTIKRYIGYFEKAYLFYTIDKHTKSFNERLTSPKKIYAGDVGVKNLITGFKDLGASYENLVFLKIKNQNPLYYLENGIEIDFLTEGFLIEAKYNQSLTEDQQIIMDSFKKRKKIVAQGVDFFLE